MSKEDNMDLPLDVDKSDPGCPYCGERISLYLKQFTQIDDRTMFFVQCGNRTCHSQGPKCDTREGAIEAFRKRHV